MGREQPGGGGLEVRNGQGRARAARQHTAMPPRAREFEGLGLREVHFNEGGRVVWIGVCVCVCVLFQNATSAGPEKRSRDRSGLTSSDRREPHPRAYLWGPKHLPRRHFLSFLLSSLRSLLGGLSLAPLLLVLLQGRWGPLRVGVEHEVKSAENCQGGVHVPEPQLLDSAVHSVCHEKSKSGVSEARGASREGPVDGVPPHDVHDPPDPYEQNTRGLRAAQGIWIGRPVQERADGSQGRVPKLRLDERRDSAGQVAVRSVVAEVTVWHNALELFRLWKFNSRRTAVPTLKPTFFWSLYRVSQPKLLTWRK